MTLDSHLTLNEISLAAGSEWPGSRDGWLLAWLRSGNGYWLHAGGPREVRQGEVMAIPPAANGSFRVSQLGAAQVVFFRWNPELLSGVLSLAEQHYFATASEQTFRILPLDGEAAARMRQVFADHADMTGLAARAHLLQIIGLVFENDLRQQLPPAMAAPCATDRFEELIGRLAESEILKFTPAELAQRCGCSLRHFGRLFLARFGVSVRARQTQLRLQKASRLLASGNCKIIDVALESGYRNLGLFNKMFKKYTGMTPSQWRQKKTIDARPKKMARLPVLSACLLAWICLAGNLQAAPTNEPVFEVQGYRIEGNSILSQSIVEGILTNYVGDKVTFSTIRKGLMELQLAYRERGFITVHVGLPQQQLTNGMVRVTVMEGRLADIMIVNNKHFSSNNIMRALPSLQTNILLNSLVLQQDLDKANANRDRQIYPEIAPGPEPGTSALRLKIKDRLPLHGNLDVNNQSTPGTPNLRMVGSVQYNNLWQLDHQVGMQYSFSPEAMRENSKYLDYWFERPQVTSYSGYYRMPIGSPAPSVDTTTMTSSTVGYDEVAKRFRPPAPAGGRPEMVVYASRSVSDPGYVLQSVAVYPTMADIIKHGGDIQTVDSLYDQSVTYNENVGFKFTQLMELPASISSFLSFGFDYKAFRSYDNQRHDYLATLFIPNSAGGFDSNQIGVPNITSRSTATSVTYLPLSFGWDASRRDRSGSTMFNFNALMNDASMGLSPRTNYAVVAQSGKATGNFFVLSSGVTRQQKLYNEWDMLLKASGQWANEPLIGNEQMGMGGLSGPRGYQDGQQYGDTGWRVSIEPRTPTVDVGMVDGTMPMRMRLSVFTDYGERYLLAPKATYPDGKDMGLTGRDPHVQMWGTGAALNGTIGKTWDFRLAFAFPLIAVDPVTVGSMHIYFGITTQF